MSARGLGNLSMYTHLTVLCVLVCLCGELNNGYIYCMLCEANEHLGPINMSFIER